MKKQRALGVALILAAVALQILWPSPSAKLWPVHTAILHLPDPAGTTPLVMAGEGVWV